MAFKKQNKPFAVKGINVTSPKGEAKWCKVTEPDYHFNAKGILSTDLVCDPNDPAVKQFISTLEELRDTALEETKATLGAKAKGVTGADLYKDEYDQDDNETGNIVFKFKLSNVDDKEPPKNQIMVVDAKRQRIHDVPLVGNGSIIRCVAYANPYYMATTKSVGVSLMWTKMQIIELNEYSGGDEFDDEDGFVAGDSDFNDEAEDKLDF